MVIEYLDTVFGSYSLTQAMSALSASFYRIVRTHEGRSLANTYLDVGRRRVKLIQQRRDSVRSKKTIRRNTVLQAILQVLGSDTVGIIRRRPERNGEVVVDRVEQSLHMSVIKGPQPHHMQYILQHGWTHPTPPSPP